MVFKIMISPFRLNVLDTQSINMNKTIAEYESCFGDLSCFDRVVIADLNSRQGSIW